MQHAISTDHVTILMAAFNGAARLRAQLASLRAQSHENWSLWVSDDGSTDGTGAILAAFQAECPQDVRILEGPRQGITANFMSMLCHADLPRGFVALCDQDDLWFDFKLARAIGLLEGCEVGLYAARTEIGEDPDGPRSLAPLHHRAPAFTNALIQTIGGGNTMVLTRGAMDIVRRAGMSPLPAHHDWWLYLLISGAGGSIIYDEKPVLFYRQHPENHMGRNRGIRARHARIKRIFSGEYCSWVDQNIATMQQCNALLTQENQRILTRFASLRHRRGLPVLTGWRKLGIHRQSRAETALMTLAAMFGKI